MSIWTWVLIAAGAIAAYIVYVKYFKTTIYFDTVESEISVYPINTATK